MSYEVATQFPSEHAGYNGQRLAICGNLLLACEPSCSPVGTLRGMVEVWRRQSAGLWTKEADIQPVGIGNNSNFGTCGLFAHDGSVLVVGAKNQDNGATNTGSVYVFQRERQGTWKQVQEIRETTAWRYFGASICTNGEFVAIGGPEPEIFGEGDSTDGWIYLYTWTTNEDGEYQLVEFERFQHDEVYSYKDGFGASCAMDDDTLVIGAPGCVAGAGRVFVYRYSGGTWENREQTLPPIGSRWGRWVAVKGNTLASYGPLADASGGCAAIYTRTGTTWTLLQGPIYEPNGQQGSRQFGRPIISSDETTIWFAADGIGTHTINGDGGSVFQYLRSGGFGGTYSYTDLMFTWDPSNQANDFGCAMVWNEEDDTFVVGASTVGGSTNGGFKVYESPGFGDDARFYRETDEGEREYCLDIGDRKANSLTGAGELVRDTSVASRCRFRLTCRRGQWWADPEVGSRLYTINNLGQARRRVKAYVQEALQDLIDDGYIKKVDVLELEEDPVAGTLSVHLSIEVPDGEAIDLGLVPLGA